MKTFREFLQEKAREPNQKERRERRDEWVAAVRRLIEQLRAWLKEADPEGLLDISQQDLEKLEHGLGAYQVPSLEISLGDAAVQVVPVGRNVVGFVGPRGDLGVRAEGRVDITDGGRKYILYRSLKGREEHWYALDEGYEAVLLDQGKFEEILQDLLS